MPLPTSSLANICNLVREHVDTLGQTPSPVDWDVRVTIGAPGANLAAVNNANTLNLFFYRFEPFGFDADALPGEVQWLRMFCVITAFGIDEDIDNDNQVDFSAGLNELRMLSQVIRLFQEQPVMLLAGDDAGEVWHTQFIPRPLADEQINQLWSTQGDTIYRPSVVYEIALAPIEPAIPAAQPARVASLGTLASGDMAQLNRAWPAGRDTLYPLVPSVAVDSANPQWAPAAVMLSGAANAREVGLTLNLEVPEGVGGQADFSAFPQVEIWIAGDSAQAGDLTLVGQLLQNPSAASGGGRWQEIDPVTGLSADADGIDVDQLPAPGATGFSLTQGHWTGIDAGNHSWQLQLWVERHIRFDAATGQWVVLAHGDSGGLRIRSNPLLITLTRESP